MSTKSTHPSDETLVSYNLGSMDSILLGAIAAHLADCEECRRRIARLSSVSSPVGVAAALAQSAEPIPPELAGHPDYRIIRELGRGGMGVVYLAENLLMGRKEVLKVVGAQLVKQKAVMERFLQEVRAAAQLHHPNIVTAFNASRLGEGIVFSMEFVEGFELAKLVETKGRLDVPLACNFIYQATLGLQHAHERGMVHRDVKPSNLMVARAGRRPVVKILDFGLAKVSSEVGVDGGLTQQGTMMGTPEYVAPEQTKDAQKADIRADVYSLGCTFYCLLAGRPPFAGSLYEILSAHHSVEPTPLAAIRPDVPPALSALVSRMMAKNPADRFQTPAEVASALAPIIREAASKAGERAVAPQSPSGRGTLVEAPPFAFQSPLGGGTILERPGIAPGSPLGGRTILENPADAVGFPLGGRTILESPSFAPQNPYGSLTIQDSPAPGGVDKEKTEQPEDAGTQNWGLIGAVAAAALLAVLAPVVVYLGRPAASSPAAPAARTQSRPVAVATPRQSTASPAKADPPRPAVPEPKPERAEEPLIADAREAATTFDLRDPSPTPDAKAPISEARATTPEPPAVDAMKSPTAEPTDVGVVKPPSSAPDVPAESTPEIKGAVTLSRLQDEMSDFDGRVVEIADLLMSARTPFVHSPKYPGGIGFRLIAKDGWNVSDGRGMFDYHRTGGKSEIQLLVDPAMAANYERKIAEYKLGNDSKPVIPTVLQVRVQAPRNGGRTSLTIVTMEVLIGYNKVRVAAGELDQNFIAVDVSGDHVDGGYADGAKWVERLGGGKFVSMLRDKVKSARSNAAAAQRWAESDVFFNQVAAMSAQMVRQNQAVEAARIRAMQNGR